MTSSEWKLVKRMALLVVVVALFPIGALVYRFWSDSVALSADVAASTPVIYTLVPAVATANPLVTPSPSPIVLVVPSGWQELTVPEESFAIAVPPRWQRLPVTSQELQATLAQIRQSNPELATALGARAQELIAGGVKLWAFDFDASSVQTRLATNLTVTRQTVTSPPSLDTYVAVNVSQLEQLSSLQGDVQHERVSIGALPAERVRYNLNFQASDGSTGVSAITQYLILAGDQAFVLTFATPVELLDKYQGTFDQSAASFRVLGQ